MRTLTDDERACSVGVLDPEFGTFVVILVDARETFDRIAAPLVDRGEQPDHGHVLVKTVKGDRVTVIFQYWLKVLDIEEIRARNERRRAAFAEAGT